MTTRRQLLLVIGAGALAPLRSLAQQKSRLWRVGVLALRGRPDSRDLGYFGSWPAICPEPEYAQEGALLSYSIDTSANYRRAAYYVDRILKGAKPGELPIEQPTVFELVVNMKTAKALGLRLPQAILVRADRVIE